MDFVKDFFVTASLALIFSYVVTKLVSMAMAGDTIRDSELNSSGNVIAREMRFEKKVVGFIGEEATMDNVDELMGGSILVESELGIVRGDDCGEEEVVAAEERCQSKDLIDGCGVNAVEGLKVKSCGVGLSKEFMEVVEKGESEIRGFEGEYRNRGLDCLVAEKRVENSENYEIRTRFSGDGRCVKDDDGIGGEDEDDWEGIERNELEKVFDTAAKFVGGGEGKDELLVNVSSDVQILLYGLHKIATEGPCYEPQPMALKVSARAKWNAWQKLGNMSPEEAMEQYITLLSDNLPGWMGDNSGGYGSHAALTGATNPNLTTSLHHQLHTADESELALKPSIQGGDMGGGLSFVNRDKE